jgi:hypothetical protein
MNKITRVLLTLSFLIALTLSANAKGSQGRINWIKHEFSQIEYKCKHGIYHTRTKTKDYGNEGEEAEIYLDRKGRVRKYLLSRGSEDSYSSAAYYYDKRGRLFFSFLNAGGVGHQFREIRSYYSRNGSLLSRKLRSNTYQEIHYYYKIKHPLRHFRNF